MLFHIGVGGGFTDAAVVLHLASLVGPDAAARIIVFEPRDRLGAGLAYSTVESVQGQYASDQDECVSRRSGKFFAVIG